MSPPSAGASKRSFPRRCNALETGRMFTIEDHRIWRTLKPAHQPCAKESCRVFSNQDCQAQDAVRTGGISKGVTTKIAIDVIVIVLIIAHPPLLQGPHTPSIQLSRRDLCTLSHLLKTYAGKRISRGLPSGDLLLVFAASNPPIEHGKTCLPSDD